jgi:hypothetical protein
VARKLDALFARGRADPKELGDQVVLRIARLRNREEECHRAALDKLGGSGPRSTWFIALCALGYS